MRVRRVRRAARPAISLPPAAGATAPADLLHGLEHGAAPGEPRLTAAGRAYLQRERAKQVLPRWLPEARQLWLGDTLLKEFRQAAPCQTALLDAFLEQLWQPHLDDPLPRNAGEGDEEATRRLQDTIRNLNRGLPPGTIRFRGNGTGQGITWEYDSRVSPRRRRAPRRPAASS